MASDRLQRVLFDDTPVRGEIAQLEATYHQALARHGYPPAIERLLGELMAGCSVLTATVKRDGILSIEIRGEGARDADQARYRRFHEQRPRLFEPAPIAFAGSCSRGRFARALHRLGADELAEHGEIETQCLFCNTVYAFSPAEVGTIIDDPDAQSPTLH